MRKHISYICTCLTATIVSSCNFLEIEHIGKSDIEGYFSSVEAVEGAVYGTHNLAYNLFDKFLILYPTTASDETIMSSSDASWITCQNFAFTQDDETGPVGYIWKYGYQVINNANQIIEHVPALREKFPNKVAQLNQYLAQAYFIRALFHHQLCLCYAQNYSYTKNASHLGIPIITKALSMNDAPKRSSVAAVYAQIISDLGTSLEYFDASRTTPNLPSRLAATALLARVYLYKGDWTKAEEYAGKVMAEVPLTPRADYVKMFNAMQAGGNSEILYALSGKRITSQACYKMYWHQEPNARPASRVTDLFEDDDIRKDIVNLNGEVVCNKYFIDDGVTEGYSAINILRVSEMYLIRAEARLMQHNSKGAAGDLEQLHKRATGNELSLGGLTEEELDLYIEQERIRELCFEGHRFWDITRRHKSLVRSEDNTSTVSSLDYPDYRFILPIPAVEIESNSNMEKNPSNNE